MKTVQFFNDHILQSAQELVEENGQPKQLKAHEHNAIKNRIEFFKTCKNYVLTSPDESFIKAEIKRLEDFISAKLLEFQEGVDTSRLSVKASSALRKTHEDKYLIPHKRKQLKCLRFLLD